VRWLPSQLATVLCVATHFEREEITRRQTRSPRAKLRRLAGAFAAISVAALIVLDQSFGNFQSWRDRHSFTGSSAQTLDGKCCRTFHGCSALSRCADPKIPVNGRWGDSARTCLVPAVT
jgi:hypothetical protein